VGGVMGFVCFLVLSVQNSAKWSNIRHLKLILILWVFGVYLCCVSGSDSVLSSGWFASVLLGF
jgi:hypothetical protein